MKRENTKTKTKRGPTIIEWMIYITVIALLFISFEGYVNRAYPAERHWINVVNILLGEQMWEGQDQELYSYTMHDAATGTSATWTYNKTSHVLMLSIAQTIKVTHGRKGKQWVNYKLSTVHLMDFKGDCTPQFAIFGDMVLTAKGNLSTLLTVPPAKISTGHKMAWNKWYAKILTEHGKKFKKKKKK